MFTLEGKALWLRGRQVAGPAVQCKVVHAPTKSSCLQLQHSLLHDCISKVVAAALVRVRLILTHIRKGTLQVGWTALVDLLEAA